MANPSLPWFKTASYLSKIFLGFKIVYLGCSFGCLVNYFTPACQGKTTATSISRLIIPYSKWT